MLLAPSVPPPRFDHHVYAVAGPTCAGPCVPMSSGEDLLTFSARSDGQGKAEKPSRTHSPILRIMSVGGGLTLLPGGLQSSRFWGFRSLCTMPCSTITFIAAAAHRQRETRLNDWWFRSGRDGHSLCRGPTLNIETGTTQTKAGVCQCQFPHPN